MSIEKICHDIASDIVTTMVPISECIPILGIPDIGSSGPDIVSFDRQYRRRYRVNIGTYPLVAKPDIAKIVPDIGFFPDIGSDIGSISGHHISKLGGYYIRLKHLSCIIHIKTLLKHIKTLLYQLKLLQFFDYYIILYHMSETNYYINYITTIISIIFICVYYVYYIN